MARKPFILLICMLITITITMWSAKKLKLVPKNSTEVDIAKNFGEVSEILIQTKRRNKMKEVCQKHAESAKSQEIALKSFLIVKQPQTILCFNYKVSYCKVIIIFQK